MSFPIKFSTMQQEGLLHCSKWLKHSVLLGMEEIISLFDTIGPHFLLSSSDLVEENSWNISLDAFLANYQAYLTWMKTYPTLPPPSLRRFFSLMLSSSLESFYAVSTSSNKIAIKAKHPVIQIQLYHCFFSSFDHEIRSMVISPDSFGWGIQIAYPQIYEDPITHQFSKVLLDKGFPNSEVFKRIVSWLRKYTQPVLFQEQEKKTSAPFRIGKDSLKLKETHQGFQAMLKAKGASFAAGS